MMNLIIVTWVCYDEFFNLQCHATLEEIPRFGLTAIKNNGIIEIKMLDEGALSYLKDIKWCKIEEDMPSLNLSDNITTMIGNTA